MAASIWPSVCLNIILNYFYYIYFYFTLVIIHYHLILVSELIIALLSCGLFIICAFYHAYSYHLHSLCVLMDFGATHDTPTSSSLLFIMHTLPHACSSSCVPLIIPAPHHARPSPCRHLIMPNPHFGLLFMRTFHHVTRHLDSSACMLLICIGIYNINNTSKPIHQK